MGNLDRVFRSGSLDQTVEDRKEQESRCADRHTYNILQTMYSAACTQMVG